MQHFGSEGGHYKVSIEVKDVINKTSLVKQSGLYTSEKDKVHECYGFNVLFRSPVCLGQGRRYEIAFFIWGAMSWYGEQGRSSVKSQGVQFTFTNSDASTNNTTVTRGQFPTLLFSC